MFRKNLTEYVFDLKPSIKPVLSESLKKINGTRNVYAERVSGGYFLDFDLNRKHIAHYGLSIEDA